MVERFRQSKTALITGAASGIGKETVKRFSRDPKYQSIFAADIDPSIGLVFQIPEYPTVIPLQIDVRKEEQIIFMLQQAASKSGWIDVIVNAAGVINAGLPWTYRYKEGKPNLELEEMYEVNLRAPIALMMNAPKFMDKEKGGVIVIITSSKYYFPDVYRLEYTKGKHMLSQVTKGLAESFKEQYNIRLVDVQPGNTKTNIDRGVWTEGNPRTEMEAVQGLNDWWRRTFGNDPKNVAEVIYKIGEGKIKSGLVFVGLDAKLGRLLFLSPIPRPDLFFLVGSSMLYTIVRLEKILKGKL